MACATAGSAICKSISEATATALRQGALAGPGTDGDQEQRRHRMQRALGEVVEMRSAVHPALTAR